MSSNGRYSRWKLRSIIQKARIHRIAITRIIFANKPLLVIMTMHLYYIYSVDMGFES
jgi:hypothetical protein